MEGIHIIDSSGGASRGDAVVVLDRYVLGRQLGSGGMGEVWAAHDTRLDRAVAVKRIACADAASARRADREAVATARLQHPAIVALYESVSEDEAVWLVSELVRGSTLAVRLADGALSDRDVLEIGVTICDALIYAHKEGVIHRDVKPQNILVPYDRGDGVPAKLTDFGIALLADDDVHTGNGGVVGTLAYMAPEQADGATVGPAADLYALGLCLYEALAGVNPVRTRGAGATARRVGLRLPPLGRVRRDLPFELCAAVDVAVWPDADRRSTVAALRRQLKAALKDAGQQPGTVAGAALETIVGRPDVRFKPGVNIPRLLTAVSAAILAALPSLALGDAASGLPTWTAASVALVCVLLLPRAGWLLAAATVLIGLAVTEPRLALVGLLAVAPVIVLLGSAPGWTWSLPGWATVAVVAGLTAAVPALSSRVTAPLQRVAVGLLAAWWIVLARTVGIGDGLVAMPTVTPLERGVGGLPPDLWSTVASRQALVLAATFAIASMLCPWLVRGRRPLLAAAAALVLFGLAAAVLVIEAGEQPLTVTIAVPCGVVLATLLRPQSTGRVA